jgi:hypothetical protein
MAGRRARERLEAMRRLAPTAPTHGTPPRTPDDYGQRLLLWQRLGGVPSSPWRDSEAPHAEVAQACRVPLLSQRQGMLPYCGGLRHSPALQCRAARRTHACTLERQPGMDVNTFAARVDNLLHLRTSDEYGQSLISAGASDYIGLTLTSHHLGAPPTRTHQHTNTYKCPHTPTCYAWSHINHLGL